MADRNKIGICVCPACVEWTVAEYLAGRRLCASVPAEGAVRQPIKIHGIKETTEVHDERVIDGTKLTHPIVSMTAFGDRNLIATVEGIYELNHDNIIQIATQEDFQRADAIYSGRIR